MYIYFNNQGVLTTNIPHGVPVRQNNPLNLYVCFSPDYFFEKQKNYEEWSAIATVVLPDGRIGASNVDTLSTNNDLVQTFYKTVDSEITYDLEDEAPYLIYRFKFSAEQATKISGKIKIVITLYNTNDLTDTIVLSPAIVYVEKTINESEQDQDNNFILRMAKIVTSLETSKANKVDIEYLTTAPTEDNTTGILKLVVLDTEPEVKYLGYIYFISQENIITRENSSLVSIVIKDN